MSPQRSRAASLALAGSEALGRPHEACDPRFCAVAGVPLAFALSQSQHKETGRKAHLDQPRGGVSVPARGVASAFFAGGNMISILETALPAARHEGSGGLAATPPTLFERERTTPSNGRASHVADEGRFAQ